MTSPREQLAELSALVQIYLLQNHGHKDWLLADPETYQYFKQKAQTQKVKPSTPPPPPPLQPLPKAPTPKTIPLETANAPVEIPAPVKEPVVVFQPEKKLSPPPEAKKTEKPKEFFVLEPLAAPQTMDLGDLRAVMNEKFPGIKIVEPTSQTAKQSLMRHIPAVAVITFHESDVDRVFLQQVTYAIQRALAPAEMWDAVELERRQEWEAVFKSPELKLIVASAHGMHRFPLLMQHYREVNKGGRIFFGKIPALLLTDLSVYRKEPQLKASLWKSLKEMLGPNV